jgi:hypothetical protein
LNQKQFLLSALLGFVIAAAIFVDGQPTSLNADCSQWHVGTQQTVVIGDNASVRIGPQCGLLINVSVTLQCGIGAFVVIDGLQMSGGFFAVRGSTPWILENVTVTVTGSRIAASDGPAVGIIFGSDTASILTATIRNVTITARNSTLSSTSTVGSFASVLGVTWDSSFPTSTIGTIEVSDVMLSAELSSMTTSSVSSVNAVAVIVGVALSGWPATLVNVVATGNVFILRGGSASATALGVIGAVACVACMAVAEVSSAVQIDVINTYLYIRGSSSVTALSRSTSATSTVGVASIVGAVSSAKVIVSVSSSVLTVDCASITSNSSASGTGHANAASTTAVAGVAGASGGSEASVTTRNVTMYVGGCTIISCSVAANDEGYGYLGSSSAVGGSTAATGGFYGRASVVATDTIFSSPGRRLLTMANLWGSLRAAHLDQAPPWVARRLEVDTGLLMYR